MYSVYSVWSIGHVPVWNEDIHTCPGRYVTGLVYLVTVVLRVSSIPFGQSNYVGSDAVEFVTMDPGLTS